MDGPTTLINHLNTIQSSHMYGFIQSVKGALIDVTGLHKRGVIGGLCRIVDRFDEELKGEIIGFHHDITHIMAYGRLEGLGPGCRVYLDGSEPVIYPSKAWLGRVINGLGEPVDHGPLLQWGPKAYPLLAAPPLAHDRRVLEYTLDVGVRAINTFLTLCQGQRMGIFAGSGVGKSVLLSQLAKFTQADVIIIGLIGERGREVREFIDKHLQEALKKAVVIVATSDEPAPMRRRAAHMTVTVAEYFRDLGLNVLCLMDSVTRFAMALREIGLSLGEMPASRGYTPSVFSELPKLLERAGPGVEEKSGDITGIFTVLVDGDDHNEPIADTVRGILDGHIVLERTIAERGRFPAINILKSVSRTLPDCQTIEEQELTKKARHLLSVYDDMADMIRLGAYRKGSSVDVDRAIAYHPLLENFLHQHKNEATSHNEGFDILKSLFADES